MTAADQIAEINAQYAERVKLLERERDAKVAMVRERCRHEFYGESSTKCRHCGEPRKLEGMVLTKCQANREHECYHPSCQSDGNGRCPLPWYLDDAEERI